MKYDYYYSDIMIGRCPICVEKGEVVEDNNKEVIWKCIEGHKFRIRFARYHKPKEVSV